MLTAVLLVCVVIFAVWLNCSPPKNFPPGPKWYPIIGNIPQVAIKLSSLGFRHLVWSELSKTYGPIVGLKLGLHKVILVSDKDLIKEVSAREEFQGRPDGFFWRMRARGGKLGIVFNDGQLWQEHRKFTMQHLKKFGWGGSVMQKFIIDEATDLVKWLKTVTNVPIDMQGLFNIPVLNAIWAMVAGRRYDREDEKLKKVCEAIHRCFRILDGSGGILEQMPIVRFIAPGACGYTELTACLNTTWNFLNETIEDHKRTFHKGIERDFIDAFLNKMTTTSEDNSSFNEKQLFVLCLDFLQAGTDTNSNTLSFFIILMMNYPNVQSKIQQEIDNVIGRIRKPTLDDRPKMPYLCAVILEVQRIINIAPAGIPHRTCCTTEIGGYTIPENTIVLLLLYDVHMNEYWKDPKVFRPERFIDDSGKLIHTDWFGAFGYGKRKCAGENFAKGTIFLFCSFLLQNLNVRRDCEKMFDPLTDIDDGISLTPKPFRAVWSIRE